MMRQPAPSAEFTGRHMLLVMLAFFGVIIAVNVTMATLANTTWSGLIVKNSYVASQHFNAQAQAARAQTALGWTGTMGYEAGTFRYTLADAAGAPVGIDASEAFFRRPVDDRHDQTIPMAPAGPGAIAGTVDLKDGIWIVEIAAAAGLDTPYREVKRIAVKGGVLQ
ncbi:FixH family protein [Aquibium sp. ELW1220]|uniref:FixH family protein n=1 Tax=Aquibium sp. ELW1220 TaxID=2976766 RepID=UPI0025AF1857|nr:FixH family protein [Aquibium sp. ELW1220]MDN2582408.1 FixH family protein [Aquibium sp. ELW1220]